MFVHDDVDPVGIHFVDAAGSRRVDLASGRVMSCDASIVVVDGSPQLARSALDRLDELERRWSRFLPDSEISRLNAAGGSPVVVSAPTRRLVVALVEAWHVTGGSFDPTLLAPLVEAGYGSSRTDPTRRTSLPPRAARRGRPDLVLVDEGTSTIRLPVGTVLDPGGLGKGLAADIVVEELLAGGGSGALVEIGGDVRAAGEPPDGDAWTIAIEHESGRRLTSVRLRDGGVATSTTTRRTWQRDGRVQHHLLDPATGAPTDRNVTSVTVVAGSARWAETLTKPAFVDGADLARALADRLDAGVLVSRRDGSTISNDRWWAFDADPLRVEPVGGATR